jgi:tetratricopeptide (TPR) repeat protein
VGLGTDPERSLGHFAALHGPGSTSSPFAQSQAFRDLGLHYLGAGEFQNGVVALREAVNTDPTNPAAWLTLGQTLLSAGLRQDALAVFRAATRQAGHADYLHFELGNAYRAAGHADSAAAAYAQAIQRDPDYLEAYVNGTLALLGAGRIQDADTLIATARERFGEHALVLNTIGSVALAQGDTIGAMVFYEAAHKKEPGLVTAAFNVGLIHLEGNRPQKAIPFFEEVVARSPGDVDAWINLGVAREAIGDVQGAGGAYAQASWVDPARPEPYFNLIRIRLAEGDTAAAIESLESFVARDSTSQLGATGKILLEMLRSR